MQKLPSKRSLNWIQNSNDTLLTIESPRNGKIADIPNIFFRHICYLCQEWWQLVLINSEKIKSVKRLFFLFLYDYRNLMIDVSMAKIKKTSSLYRYFVLVRNKAVLLLNMHQKKNIFSEVTLKKNNSSIWNDKYYHIFVLNIL